MVQSVYFAAAVAAVVDMPAVDCRSVGRRPAVVDEHVETAGMAPELDDGDSGVAMNASCQGPALGMQAEMAGDHIASLGSQYDTGVIVGILDFFHRSASALDIVRVKAVVVEVVVLHISNYSVGRFRCSVGIQMLGDRSALDLSTKNGRWSVLQARVVEADHLIAESESLGQARYAVVADQAWLVRVVDHLELAPRLAVRNPVFVWVEEQVFAAIEAAAVGVGSASI